MFRRSLGTHVPTRSRAPRRNAARATFWIQAGSRKHTLRIWSAVSILRLGCYSRNDASLKDALIGPGVESLPIGAAGRGGRRFCCRSRDCPLDQPLGPNTAPPWNFAAEDAINLEELDGSVDGDFTMLNVGSHQQHRDSSRVFGITLLRGEAACRNRQCSTRSFHPTILVEH